MPRLRKPSRICGTAAAASSRSTVIRTSSEPARASAATCATVPATSAVSVLVIDCTTIGAPPPTATLPTMTWVVLCRALGPATSSDNDFSGLFMGSTEYQVLVTFTKRAVQSAWLVVKWNQGSSERIFYLVNSIV